jgi:zinc-binding in reverse transcriptase
MYVLHRNQPITCFETSTLQTSYNRERLWQYMIERHKWSKRTAATVNLNALRAARNKSPSLQRFTTRLLQGHVPTLHRLHQQGRTTSNLCPRCQNKETHDHMFQCPYREEWRKGFLKRLDSHLENHETDPYICEEVLECTRAWLKATQPNHQAHYNQLDVGIHLLHRGLLGVDWSYRQQAHYQSNNLPQTGHLWAQHLILFLWEEAFELWTQRNNDIHEPDKTIQRQDLIQQVEEIYELEPLTLAQDRDNFCIPLNTRLTHNTNQLHNYVQSQGYIVRASVREAANLAAQTFQPIRDFFTRR